MHYRWWLLRFDLESWRGRERSELNRARLLSNCRARTFVETGTSRTYEIRGACDFALSNEFGVCSGNESRMRMDVANRWSSRILRILSVWRFLQKASVVAIAFARKKKD